MALGEDGAEAAFGEDVLGDRLAEHVQIDYEGRLTRLLTAWTYAPIDLEWISLDDGAAWEYQRYEGPALGVFDRE